MKNIKHLYLVAVIAVTVACLAGITFYLLRPASFGTYGEFAYRRDSLEENKEQPMVYIKDNTCMSDSCHGEKADEDLQVFMANGHENMNCQTCHGIAKEHVDDPENAAHKPLLGPAKDWDDYTEQEKAAYSKAVLDLCMGCHQTRAGLPKDFPSIPNFADHKKQMRGEDEESCVDCHDYHACETY